MLRYSVSRFKVGMDAYQKGDFSTAIKEFQPTAKQGDVESQWLLGSSYANANKPNKPLPQQFNNALKWFKAAAEQGHVRAMLDIGLLYMFYQEEKDSLSAVLWIQRAAEHNNAEAQFLLGLMYFSGDSMSKDYTRAYMWWILAAEKGHLIAKQMLQKSLDVITTNQISEAKQMAQKWKPSE